MVIASAALLTVGLTTVLVALLMVGMAVGVIFSNRELAGSCGGSDADCVCEKKERGECPHDQPEAEALPGSERLVSAARLTDAMKP